MLEKRNSRWHQSRGGGNSGEARGEGQTLRDRRAIRTLSGLSGAQKLETMHEEIRSDRLLTGPLQVVPSTLRDCEKLAASIPTVHMGPLRPRGVVRVD